MPYNAEEREKCVEWFIEEGKSFASFQKIYRREFRAVDCNAKAPSKNRIKEWYAKFQQGDLRNKKREGIKYVRTPEKTAEVVELFQALPSRQWEKH